MPPIIADRGGGYPTDYLTNKYDVKTALLFIGYMPRNQRLYQGSE